MMHLIFNGPPGSGKDEACRFLVANYGFKHLEFKASLFTETATLFRVDLEWLMKRHQDRALKEKPASELGGLSVRQALIYTSESVLKPKYGSNIFGLKVADSMDGISSYCFSDGGFVDELRPVINKVGQECVALIQLYRTGSSFQADSRSYIEGNLQCALGFPQDYKSVQNKQDLPIRMYRVCNDSSISNFYKNIRKILRKEANVDISHFSRESL